MKNFNLEKFSTRLALSFGALGLMVVLLVAFTLSQVASIQGKVVKINSLLLPVSVWIQYTDAEVKQSSYLLLAELDNQSDASARELLWKEKINPAIDSITYFQEQFDDADDDLAFMVNEFLDQIKKVKLAQQALASYSFEEAELDINLSYYPDLDEEGKIDPDSNFTYWLEEQIADQIAGNEKLIVFLSEMGVVLERMDQISENLKDALQEQVVSLRADSFKAVGRFKLIEAIVIFLVLALGFALYIFLRNHIQEAIKSIQTQLAILSEGNIPDNFPKRKDEMQELMEEVSVLSTNLRAVKSFALEVGKGQFDNDISVFNNQGDIGSSLAEMRESLKKVAEEDKLRYWANQGYAQFGDILRRNVDSMSSLCDQLIGQLVKYLNANQGGIFLLEEQGDEKYLELMSCYAYERHKYLEKKMQIGEGLVGQCFLEEEVIYLKDIPERYVRITSGLGNAKPRNLILVPLKFNDVVYGVIEIASFYEIMPHQQDFLVKVAESIASTISSVRVNEHTKKLLEDSQELTEQMRAQEEEMRQNMEELEATQEEIHRKQNETARVEKQFREISENVPGVLFQMEMENEDHFRITYISAACKTILGILPDDAKKARKISALFKTSSAEAEKFQSMLFQSSMSGKEFVWTAVVQVKGESKYIEITARPGKNAHGDIMWNGFIIDLTAEHEKFSALENELKQVKSQLEQLAINPAPATTTSTVDTSAEKKAKSTESQEELLKKLKENEEKLRASFKKKK